MYRVDQRNGSKIVEISELKFKFAIGIQKHTFCKELPQDHSNQITIKISEYFLNNRYPSGKAVTWVRKNASPLFVVYDLKA